MRGFFTFALPLQESSSDHGSNHERYGYFSSLKNVSKRPAQSEIFCDHFGVSWRTLLAHYFSNPPAAVLRSNFSSSSSFCRSGGATAPKCTSKESSNRPLISKPRPIPPPGPTSNSNYETYNHNEGDLPTREALAVALSWENTKPCGPTLSSVSS